MEGPARGSKGDPVPFTSRVIFSGQATPGAKAAAVVVQAVREVREMTRLEISTPYGRMVPPNEPRPFPRFIVTIALVYPGVGDRKYLKFMRPTYPSNSTSSKHSMI
jgi:hypothetical protein